MPPALSFTAIAAHHLLLPSSHSIVYPPLPRVARRSGGGHGARLQIRHGIISSPSLVDGAQDLLLEGGHLQPAVIIFFLVFEINSSSAGHGHALQIVSSSA